MTTCVMTKSVCLHGEQAPLHATLVELICLKLMPLAFILATICAVRPVKAHAATQSSQGTMRP
jgi:hypothetical protein